MFLRAYGLDMVSVCPKGLCMVCLASRVVVLEGDGTFKMWDLMGGLWVIGDCPQKELEYLCDPVVVFREGGCK